MQAYLDANVYVAYFLGEENEELVARLFRRSLECRFSITASGYVYGEVQTVCGNRAQALMQHHVDLFESAKKVNPVRASPLDLEWAAAQNQRTGRMLGITDWIHARLASEHSDALVSSDRRLRELAAPWVRCYSVLEFLNALQP